MICANEFVWWDHKVKVTQKSLFHDQIWHKNEKNVFIKFICFSILVLCIAHFLVTQIEGRVCTIAHRQRAEQTNPQIQQVQMPAQRMWHFNT